MIYVLDVMQQKKRIAGTRAKQANIGFAEGVKHFFACTMYYAQKHKITFITRHDRGGAGLYV